MSDWDNKEVQFAYYCPMCKHWEKEGYKDPCNDCLEVPMRTGTGVPEKYEAKGE